MFDLRSKNYPWRSPQQRRYLDRERTPAKSTSAGRATDNGSVLEGLFILVVDDEPDVRELVALFLHLYGARVITASSPAEACAVLAKKDGGNRPDVILSDISMPEEDGYDFIHRVRESNELKQVPVIALTTLNTREDHEKIINAGFRAHLIKPPDPDDLARQIAKLTGRAIHS